MIVSEQYYQPAASITVIATSMTELNQANLFADFSTKRASRVLVDMCCAAQSVNSGSLFFGLRDSAGNVIGSKQGVYITTTTDTHRVFYRQPIVVVPNQNYRWYWAAMVSVGAQFDCLGTTPAGDENFFSMIVTAEDE